MPGKRYALEYDKQKKKEKLNTATKQLKDTIIKENMREFRMKEQKEREKMKKDYGKVEYEVAPRQRNDQIRKLEHRRIKENMERRRKNSEKIHKFYAAKDEETDSDSDEEEDDVLDFHKQKSEVIFWNDPRIRMTKKDMHFSTLARSFGIMTITVEDTEEEQKGVKEEHHLQLKGDQFSSNTPLDRLRRNGLHQALVPRYKHRGAQGWNMNPENQNIRECKPVYFLW